MSENAVLLLGTPVWEYEETALSIPSQKGRALLWYCAANPGRMFTRSHVAGLLWGTFSDTDSRNSLNTTLTRLRHMLPVVPLRFSGDLIGWDPLSMVRVDLHAYLELAGDMDQPASAHGGRRRDQVESALALWRGTFLEGFEVPDAEGFMQWLSAERLHWDRRLLASLARLIQFYESAGAWQLVIDRAHRALAIDPLQERFHRAIMVAYHRIGDRAAALGQYSILTDILAEMRLGPDPDTEALVEQISGRSPDGAPVANAPAPTTAPPSSEGVGVSHLLPGSPPFVGRAPQVDAIVTYLHALATHTAGAILLSGETGIGKSRIAQEAIQRLTAAPADDGKPAWAVLHGVCHSELRGLPFSGCAEILATAWDTLAPGAQAIHADELAPLGALVPDIHRHAGTAAPAALDQRAVLRAALTLLDSLDRPALLLFEDLEGADPDTLTLLSYLLQSRPRHTIRVIGTVRGGSLPPDVTVSLRRLARQGRLASLPVEGFDVPATLELCSHLDPNADIHGAIRLHNATGGNPFMIVETARLLAAAPEGWQTQPLPISDGVRALVQERMANLTSDARAMTQALCGISRPVPIDLLQQHVGYDDARFVAAAEELLATGLVVEHEGNSDDDGVIDFACDLCRAAVSASLSLTRRATLRRAARRLPDGWHASGR